jgi:putative transcriptional regulator
MIEIRLKKLLDEREKTFYWLAKNSGVAHRTLWRLKTGNAEAITLEVLDKVCRTLDCQPGDLLVRTDEVVVQEKRISRP